MEFRYYDAERDREAAHRIWREAGWLEEKDDEKAMDLIIGACRSLVADLNGEAESFAATCDGMLKYQDEDLPLSCITGVATSHVARQMGFASQLTAAAMAADVADGALVAALGMFDQGYYNRLGFGAYGYDHTVSFDPTLLKVSRRPRPPRRLTPDDAGLVHASRLARSRTHGACNLLPPEATEAEMIWGKKQFGLGYCDGPDGELTHHVWGELKGGEYGPFQVKWLTYRNMEQFLELMALLKNLGEQIRLVRLCEPAGIQLQDLIHRPIRHRDTTRGSKYESTISAGAWYQARICDLAGCLEHTHLRGDTCRFNLELSDPIEEMLPEDAPWHGIAGEYIITLGPSSGAEQNRDPALPSLKASVGAFTRLWLGIRPATGLGVTDDLAGPVPLFEKLDAILRLPDPRLDWDF